MKWLFSLNKISKYFISNELIDWGQLETGYAYKPENSNACISWTLNSGTQLFIWKGVPPFVEKLPWITIVGGKVCEREGINRHSRERGGCEPRLTRGGGALLSHLVAEEAEQKGRAERWLKRKVKIGFWGFFFFFNKNKTTSLC